MSFDSSAPGAYTGSTSITGVQPNEQILTIDFRPRTGQLYGLGSTLPDAVGKHASSRIYTIDPLTGAASAVAAAFAVPLDGFAFGFSFNPVTDQIRVVSDHGQNLRVDPDSGAVVVDPALAFAPGDPSQAERPPMIAAAAYTNHAASAATTTLFDYSAQGPDLVRQGSPGGSPLSPDSGQLFTVARTAVFSLKFVGFSIPPGSGSGFFCGSQFGPSSFDSELYTVDLTTGATRNLGTIANGAEPVTGIAVSPGGNAQSVAEYCAMAMLMLARNIVPITSSLRQTTWDAARTLGAGTHEIAEMTLGLVGVGHIGSRLARIARQGFGMRVLGNQRRLDRLPPEAEACELAALVSESDFVVLTCPLTAQTQHLFNRERLRSMRPGAWLINVGRGPVVEESALVEVLRERRIAGAMLDVYEHYRLEPGHPLFSLDNVILTPHLAGMTQESRARMGVAAAEEMLRMLAGEPPHHFVNPDSRRVNA